MVKKVFTSIFLFVMIFAMAFSLTGCGDTDSSTDDTEPVEDADEEIIAVPEDDLEDDEAIAVAESTDTSDAEDEDEDEDEDVDNEISFTPVTLIENDDVVVRIESLDVSNGTYTFNFYLENNTDMNLMFSCDDVVVNGVMCDPFWATTVSPGMKAYSDITFYLSRLEESGINYIETVEMPFRIYDDDNWASEYLFDDTLYFSVSNTTDEPSTYQRVSSTGFSSFVLLENEYIRVTVIDYDPDYAYGPDFLLYLENFTDSTVMFSVDDASINGFMADPFWAKTVSPNAVAYSDLYWSNGTLEDNFIDEIETVSFNFRAYDDDDWAADYFYDDTVGFSLNNDGTVSVSSDSENDMIPDYGAEEADEEELTEDTTTETADEENTESATAYTPTTGEKNALGSAESYLKYSSFSYSGLIGQLEYEGYSTEEATYAADNCGADWYEQALKSADSYLKYTAFSYSGLIGQLEYEGYSTEEATYAADNCGADWYEQAAKSAESYTKYMSFSKQQLIDQLEYGGFTYDQALYGVEAVGY